MCSSVYVCKLVKVVWVCASRGGKQERKDTESHDNNFYEELEQKVNRLQAQMDLHLNQTKAEHIHTHSHTHTHSLSLSLSLSHTHTHNHTHLHTHTLSLSFVLERDTVPTHKCSHALTSSHLFFAISLSCPNSLCFIG